MYPLCILIFMSTNKQINIGTKMIMINKTKVTSTQYQKNMQSNAKTEDLFRKIQNNENQWFAFDFILDHFNEDQKVKIRKYIKDLIKEEKTNN